MRFIKEPFPASGHNAIRYFLFIYFFQFLKNKLQVT